MKTLHKIAQYKGRIAVLISMLVVSNLFAYGYFSEYWSTNKERYQEEVFEEGDLWSRLVSTMYYLIIQDTGEKKAGEVLSKEEIIHFYTECKQREVQNGQMPDVRTQEREYDELYDRYMSTLEWLEKASYLDYYIKNESTGAVITNKKELAKLDSRRVADTEFDQNDMLYELKISGKNCTTTRLAGRDYIENQVDKDTVIQGRFSESLTDGFEQGYMTKFDTKYAGRLAWIHYVRPELEKNPIYTIYFGIKDIRSLANKDAAIAVDEEYNQIAILWFYLLQALVLLIGMLVVSHRKQEGTIKYRILEIPAAVVALICILLPIFVVNEMFYLFAPFRNQFGSIGLFVCMIVILYAASILGTMKCRGFKKEFEEHSLIGRWHAANRERRASLLKREKREQMTIIITLGIKGLLFSILIVIVCGYRLNECYSNRDFIFGIIVPFLLCLIYIWGIWFRTSIRKVISRNHNYQLLLEKAREMAEGNIETKITEDLGEFNELAEVLNHIGEGLKKAVEEAVTSQSMKTELITNVSHDLKTPLTSIVSYVDLLKNGDLTESDRREFIEILEQKSARLKVLIEDLFEMSKAASKDIKLTVSELNVVSLTKEVLVEYEQALDEKNLKVNLSFVSDTIKVSLDGQKTYRIISNLIGNITKYTMPHTRVYISVTKDEEQVFLEFKNISATEITHQGKELLERFVREDASRNTEGSGLGLAIAKSLTELQNGTLEVEADGDLFKAVVAFPLAR